MIINTSINNIQKLSKKRTGNGWLIDEYKIEFIENISKIFKSICFVHENSKILELDLIGYS